MNDDGTGLAYKDQEAAEAKASEWRREYMDLLSRVTMLNAEVDSYRLQMLIEDASRRVQNI